IGGVRIDAQSPGQRICSLKAEAPHVGGQAIGIGANDVQRLIAIRLVDADRPAGADAVGLEKDHDVAHGLLFLPALADALNAARADALDLVEVCWALVDDIKGALTEGLDDLPGEVWPDALDEPGAKIFLDAFQGVRRGRFQLTCLELWSVIAVLHP